MNNMTATGQFQKTDNINTTEHKCKDCGGFYCATCHSTIPPQYRPSKVLQTDQKTLQYYKKVVYPNNCGNRKDINKEIDCKDCN